MGEKVEDVLEIYSQGNVSHGHIGCDKSCLEHTLGRQGGGVASFPCLVLLDVAWCCGMGPLAYNRTSS